MEIMNIAENCYVKIFYPVSSDSQMHLVTQILPVAIHNTADEDPLLDDYDGYMTGFRFFSIREVNFDEESNQKN